MRGIQGRERFGWMMSVAVTVALAAGTLKAQARPPTAGRGSVDGLALLASDIAGIHGQVEALRSKLATAQSAARCCTGEVAALRTALDVLRVDADNVSQAYRAAHHAEGLRRAAEMKGQIARLGRALDALRDATDVQGARADATHVAAAANALRQTIADAVACCVIWLSP